MTISEAEDLRHSLHNIKGKTKITKKCLQSIAGKLNWATQCVYGGRFHLTHILDKIKTLNRPWHHKRLNKDMMADINWWLRFMEYFNGQTKMVDNRPAAPVCTDASNEAVVLSSWENVCMPHGINTFLKLKNYT